MGKATPLPRSYTLPAAQDLHCMFVQHLCIYLTYSKEFPLVSTGWWSISLVINNYALKTVLGLYFWHCNSPDRHWLVESPTAINKYSVIRVTNLYRMNIEVLATVFTVKG